MQKIIIDTDIGDDVDDALAIAYALCVPEIKISGITTVFGDVKKRAAQTKMLTRLFEQTKIPIYEGCETPLNGLPKIIKEPYLWNKKDEGDYIAEKKSAVDFIIETIAEFPETVLVAIGPLTNIARAIQQAPEVMSQAVIYVMGGAFDSAFAEYNIACDPEAVECLLGAVAQLRFFGIEETSRTFLTEEDENIMLKHPGKGQHLICRMVKDIKQKRGFVPYLHDVFPIYGLLHPELCTYIPKKIWIEKQGQYTRGTVIVDKDYFHNHRENPNVEITVIRDAQNVKQSFLNVVFNY